MSAAIDSMLYVGEVPWHGLGRQYEIPPSTPAEIVAGANLGWEVGDKKMVTDIHDRVLDYHAIYRKDTNDILGVVNKSRIIHTQNADMFNALTDILSRDIITETAASLDGGVTVFGCFKIADQYKVLDDDVEHYFVIVNDHLKCDGKITVLNTPVRVVCQNTLTAALNNHTAKIRIPISADNLINAELARKIIAASGNAITNLSDRAENLATQMITKKAVDKVLDELFPYIEVQEGETTTHDRANEKVEMMRDTFMSDCMGADNLGNFRGSKYQLLNAVLDFEQHYYSNVDKSYDLRHRMSLIPGVTTTTNIPYSTKVLKMMDHLELQVAA